MITSVTYKEFVLSLAKENPSWTEEAISNESKECLSCWDDRLDPIVSKYIKEGVCCDFRYGEFSIFLIRALRNNCGFLKAISLMNSYLKDPINGKALILKRNSL
jgi:hypothetical protein